MLRRAFARVFGSASQPEQPAPAAETNGNDCAINDDTSSSATHTPTSSRPGDLGLFSQLSFKRWGRRESLNAPSAPVDTASSMTETKVDVLTSLEANESHSISGATSEPVGGTQGGVINDGHTWKWDFFNTAVDTVLLVIGDLLEENSDTIENAEAVAVAKASGVKIRDFVAKPSPIETQQIHTANVPGIPEIFRAEEMVLRFYYLRFLFKNGIFDFPHCSLTVEDVDRLHTIGWVRTEDFDFILGCAMLGHGAYRRMLRAKSTPVFKTNMLKHRSKWTIPHDAVRPTEKRIDNFIRKKESLRLGTQKEYGRRVYRLCPSERLRLDYGWVEWRLQRFGVWGLGDIGIHDAQVVEMIEEIDKSYVPPDVFYRQRTRFIGDTYWQTAYTKPESTCEDVAAPGNIAQQPAFPISINSIPFPTSDSPPRSSSSQIPVETPAAISRQSSQPACGHSSSYKDKGKKRQRSASPETTQDDGPPRRIRTRTYEEDLLFGAISSIKANQRLSGTITEPSSTHGTTQCKKRALEDTSELDAESPSKKRKGKSDATYTVCGPNANDSSTQGTVLPSVNQKLEQHHCKVFNNETGEYIILTEFIISGPTPCRCPRPPGLEREMLLSFYPESIATRAFATIPCRGYCKMPRGLAAITAADLL